MLIVSKVCDIFVLLISGHDRVHYYVCSRNIYPFRSAACVPFPNHRSNPSIALLAISTHSTNYRRGGHAYPAPRYPAWSKHKLFYHDCFHRTEVWAEKEDAHPRSVLVNIEITEVSLSEASLGRSCELNRWDACRKKLLHKNFTRNDRKL